MEARLQTRLYSVVVLDSREPALRQQVSSGGTGCLVLNSLTPSMERQEHDGLTQRPTAC